MKKKKGNKKKQEEKKRKKKKEKRKKKNLLHADLPQHLESYASTQRPICQKIRSKSEAESSVSARTLPDQPHQSFWILVSWEPDAKVHRVELVREKVLVLRPQVNAQQVVAVASQSVSGGIP